MRYPAAILTDGDPYSVRPLMPRKVSRDALCAFCGQSTEGSREYVEVEVSSPAAMGPQRQLLGAHARCMTTAMEASGTEVELDLLLDP